MPNASFDERVLRALARRPVEKRVLTREERVARLEEGGGAADPDSTTT